MFRCGLAASMDHTLRLQYSAQDSQQYTAFANGLANANNRCLMILDAGVVPLLPPSGGAHNGSRDQGAGSSGGGAAAGMGSSNDEAPGSQLGLLPTLSKRAAMLMRALEVVGPGMEADGGAGGSTRGQQGGLPERQVVVQWAAEVMAMLRYAGEGVEAAVRDRVEAGRREAAAAGASAVGGGGGTGEEVCREDVVCVDEVHEALALDARAASHLATTLGWQLAMDIGTAAKAAAGGGPAVQSSLTWRSGTRVVADVLLCSLFWWRGPLLPLAQLLACQPQRLLAAAGALAAALPVDGELGHQKQRLCVLASGLVAFLASHKTLSGRVRGWLLEQPPAAASGSGGGTGSGSGSGGGPELDAFVGCLYGPIASISRHTMRFAPSCSVYTMSLLELAKGQIKPKRGVSCCPGGRDATGEPDGGFREFAAAVAQRLWERTTDTSLEGFSDVLLPDGISPMHEAQNVLAGKERPPPPPPSPPSCSLPPPLALPPSRAGALPRLRVCGNPRCCNFAGESEGALPLKQCGGCRAVRYCGADCQRAHWREGHRAECKALAE